MYFRKVGEKESIDFVRNVLDFYSTRNRGSTNVILTSADVESNRNNAGWYNHNHYNHQVFINIPNILLLNGAIDKGYIDNDTYYAFLTLCVGHEFRHFLQGKCIWDDESVDGYNKEDAFNTELMLYISSFFDGYYKLNKGYIKSEEDAEKYAIQEGIAYLKENYPGFEAEAAMMQAIKYYAYIQSCGSGVSTLPRNCNSIKEVISFLDRRMEENLRISNLRKTLSVYNPILYLNHIGFSLNKNKLLTPQLIDTYPMLHNGSAQDLLVVAAILSQIKRAKESLNEFPDLQKVFFKR